MSYDRHRFGCAPCPDNFVVAVDESDPTLRVLKDLTDGQVRIRSWTDGYEMYSFGGANNCDGKGECPKALSVLQEMATELGLEVL